MKKDFQFVESTMQEFFEQEEIQTKLNQILEHDLTGWEIWLQIELALFLKKQPGIAESYRECTYTIDRRKTKKKYSIAVDFLIRRKNYTKDYFIGIEIKQNQSAISCISNMLDDATKVANIRGSEDDMRSLWNVGIHPEFDSTELKREIERLSVEKDVELVKNCLSIKKIPNTEFSFTIF